MQVLRGIVPLVYRLWTVRVKNEEKRVPAETFHVPQIAQMDSWRKEKEN